MAYIGNQVRSIPFVVDNFSGDASNKNFTLSRIPASSASIAVFVNGLYQQPTANYTLSVQTLSFTNAPSSGSGCYVTVVITQDGTGSRTPTFSPSPKWTDGVSPTYSGANKTDVISFLCVAGSFYGSLAMANM